MPQGAPTIGILAGMGARSTAPFVDLVVDECQRQYGARHDDEYPPMMILSLPTPFRLDRPPDHEALGSAVRAGLVRLAATGVAFVAMPCNTVHMYYEDLARAIDVPLLDMIEIAVAAVPESVERVAPLATAVTMEAGLYQRALASRGFEVVDEPWIRDGVLATLRAVKGLDPGVAARALWTELLEGLQRDSVDAALLACTDLNPARSADEPPIPIVDATATLAASTVATWLGLGARTPSG